MTTESSSTPKPVLIKALNKNDSLRSSETGLANPFSDMDLLNAPFVKHSVDRFDLNSSGQTKNASVSARVSHLLLRIIRAAQPISRVDLARRLNINRGNVTSIVNPLIDKGILREGKVEMPLVSRRGRPPVGLWLHSHDVYFIGVNLGVRQTQVAVETADGKGRGTEVFDTVADKDQAIENVILVVARLLSTLSHRRSVLIGVTVPGPVDSERSKLLYAPHLGWSDLPIAQLLQRGLVDLGYRNEEISVVVENDAIAAAVYEARQKLHASNCSTGDDFVLVRAGTGIGVGVVLGGEVYRGIGIGGLVGEFGHMTIVAGGKPCVCGNRGCWERYASARSAASLYTGDRLHFRGAKPPRFLEIVSRAEAGELRAQRTLEQVGDYLGIGISNVISGLGISDVIVSGRVVYGWKFIAPALRSAVAQTMVGRLTKWSVEAGTATGAGLGGAIEVAVENYLASVVPQTRESVTPKNDELPDVALAAVP